MMGKVEEDAFRHGSRFDDLDIDGIQKMYDVGMRHTLFDKLWIDTDQKSLKEFLHECNKYDDWVKYF